MKIGFLYAGQGAQHVGMGKDLYEAYPEFREVFDNVKLDFDVKECCFDGPIEKLGQTRYTQPCMVAFAVGVTKILAAKGIVPEIAAGLSLGEYSALYAAGVFEEQQVIDLVAYRGKSMEEAVTGRDTGMIAVMNLDRETIKACCKQAEEEFADSEFHIAEVANYNTPVQVTVSGDTPVITRAGELMMEKGARRIVPVAVSGPFHTSLMKPAGDKLAERFKTEHFGEMKFPVLYPQEMMNFLKLFDRSQGGSFVHRFRVFDPRINYYTFLSMYVGDRSGTPYMVKPRTLRPSFWKDITANLIQV
mgnify:CR=1 FL=1